MRTQLETLEIVNALEKYVQQKVFKDKLWKIRSYQTYSRDYDLSFSGEKFCNEILTQRDYMEQARSAKNMTKSDRSFRSHKSIDS